MIRVRVVQGLRALDLIYGLAERYLFLDLYPLQLVRRLRVHTRIIQIPIVELLRVLALFVFVVKFERRRLDILLHFLQLLLLYLLIYLTDMIMLVRKRRGAQMIVITRHLLPTMLIFSKRRQLPILRPLMLLLFDLEILLTTLFVFVDHLL